MIKVIEFIIISGITIVASLIFTLLKAKKKELHFKLLTLFFVVLLCYLVIGYADINQFKYLIVLVYPIVDNIELILGPLIYLYVNAIFNQKKKLAYKDLLHFIPLGIYFLVFTTPEFISIFSEGYIFDYLNILDTYDRFFYLFLISYLIVYTYASKLKFNHYDKIYKNHYASASVDNISWVNHMLIGILIVCCLDFSIDLFCWLLNKEDDTLYITMLMAAIFINYLGYYGTNQSKLLLPEGNIIFKPKTKNTLPKEVDQHKKTLEQLFQNDKIHRDEELNLQVLANKMNLNPKKLSHLLNNHLNTNFYELVNQQRVEDVKAKINSPEYDKHTLIEIAYECGFQSKASFNRIFKKQTQISPTEYKRKTLQKTS